MSETRPVRVLVANPSTELYGADRMLLETVEALREAGHHVVVTVPSDGPLLERLNALDVPVRHVNVPVLRRGYLSPAGIVRILADGVRAWPACRRTIRSVAPDVLYVNTLTFPLWALAGRLSRRPVVVHVHELEDSVAKAIQFALVAPVALAKTVVVNSAATARFLAQASPLLAGRMTKRTRLVYNGVAEPPRPPTTRPAPGDEVRLAYVGRLSHRKGTDTALEAVAQLAEAGVNATLDVHGDVFAGNEEFARELRQLAADRGIADRVRWRGFSDSVWAAYDAADIVLVPSRAEPFGLVAVEAQLADRPVIVTAAQGLVEAVAADETGTVVPVDDPTALAEAVQKLLADWPTARARSERGGRRARELFSPAGYRAGIVDVLTGSVD